jgi:hypothetical protein
MTPEQISLACALIGIFSKMGAWPLGVVIFLVIGPWIMSLLLAYLQRTQHAAAVRMYENNVTLAESSGQLAKDLKEVVIMNTLAFQRLADDIEQNQFCPAVRLEKRAGGLQS